MMKQMPMMKVMMMVGARRVSWILCSILLTNLLTLVTAESLSSEFDMASWPVSDRCKDHLHELVSSHNIQPLPTYDENHNLISPSQYESKLKGALVKVHMAIYHHHIKPSKHDIFNAVLRELIVLALPAALPTSPFKCRHLKEGPSTERRNKGKTPFRG